MRGVRTYGGRCHGPAERTGETGGAIRPIPDMKTPSKLVVLMKPKAVVNRMPGPVQSHPSCDPLSAGPGGLGRASQARGEGSHRHWAVGP